MPRSSSPLIIAVALVVIGLILASLNASGNNVSNPNLNLTPTSQITAILTPTTVPTVTLSPANPDSAVTLFYNWYLSQTPPVPATDYQASPYLSDVLKRRLAAMSSVSIVNTLLCGSQNPLTFTATTMGTPTESNAQVTVEQVFPTGNRLVPVNLIKLEDMWQINSVTCTKITPPLSPPTSPGPSASPSPNISPTNF